MSLGVTRWGSIKRSGGLISAILKQARHTNYGAASKLTFAFDPFFEHPSAVKQIRTAQWFMNTDKLKMTNPKVVIRTEVASDRSEPTLSVEMNDGSRILLKTENLSALEIMTLFNEHVSAKAEKKVEEVHVQTKAEKAAMAKKRR